MNTQTKLEEEEVSEPLSSSEAILNEVWQGKEEGQEEKGEDEK